MRHHELGTKDGPLILFGGPYSNLHAFEALVAVAHTRGLAGDEMICTGDVVAYCGAPRETVAAVRRAGVHVVAGNCEVQLAASAPDCGCGFETGSACDLLSASWYGFAAARITPDQRAWMAKLPEIATFTHQGARYGVIHGGVSDIARFIWPNSGPEVFADEWRAAEAVAGPLDHIICGHSGIPFIQAAGRGRWINAGAIGMPPHDGGQQTRYGVLDGGEVTLHRLSYDVAAATRKMAGQGLRQGYGRALRTGYWPSEDVLPPGLRVPSLARG